MSHILHTRDRQVVITGREVGRGGEGAIYLVKGNEELVIKLLHPDRRTPDRLRKLEAMISAPPVDPMESRGHRSITWPVDLLFADPDARVFVGFTMPRIPAAAQPLFKMFMPEERAQRFPGSSLRHLATTARNLAAAVSAIHAAGHCIGDLNESNVLVAPSGMVTIIDTDSFQVTLPDGTRFPAPVGKSEYTAPELQDRPFEESVRTPESDNFALAILIFQLLMQGFHPHAGVVKVVDGDPPSVEQKIARGLYAHAGLAAISPPRRAPDIGILPEPVRAAFRRTFVAGAQAPAERVTAAEWVQLMDDLLRDLQPCRILSHEYPRHLDACPWCELKNRRGIDYFPEGPGLQVPVITAGDESDPAVRLRVLRQHIATALSGGYLSPEAERHLGQMARSMGLAREFPGVLEEEMRRRGAVRGLPPDPNQWAELVIKTNPIDFGLVSPGDAVAAISLPYSNKGSGALRARVAVEPPQYFTAEPAELTHNSGEISVRPNTQQMEWERAYRANLVITYNGQSGETRQTIPLTVRVKPNTEVGRWLFGVLNTQYWIVTILGFIAVGWFVLNGADPLAPTLEWLVTRLRAAGFLVDTQWAEPELLWTRVVPVLFVLGGLTLSGKAMLVTPWLGLPAFVFVVWAFFAKALPILRGQPYFADVYTAVMVTLGTVYLVYQLGEILFMPFVNTVRTWLVREGRAALPRARAVAWLPVLLLSAGVAWNLMQPDPVWSAWDSRVERRAAYEPAQSEPEEIEHVITWPKGTLLRTEKRCDALFDPPVRLNNGTHVWVIDPDIGQPGEEPSDCAPEGWTRIRTRLGRKAWIPSDTHAPVEEQS